MTTTDILALLGAITGIIGTIAGVSADTGKIPTTIKMLSLMGFNSKKEMKKRYGEEVSIIMKPAYATLPVRLNPGDDWFGAFKQNHDEIRKFFKYKHFIVQIEDTMSKKRFRAEIDKSQIKP